MLFNIAAGDVVRPVDAPHKVGVVQGWTSNGVDTLVTVKFHGQHESENFGYRSLDLVAPHKPRTKASVIWSYVVGAAVLIVGALFGVDFLVSAFGWSDHTDWVVSGLVVVTLWGVVEGRYKKRGRTKIKSARNVTVTKTAK